LLSLGTVGAQIELRCLFVKEELVLSVQLLHYVLNEPFLR
jgi:hypothetical protein